MRSLAGRWSAVDYKESQIQGCHREGVCSSNLFFSRCLLGKVWDRHMFVHGTCLTLQTCNEHKT